MKSFLKSSTILIIGDLITKILSTLYLIPLLRIDEIIGKLNAVLLIPFGLMVVVGTLGLNIILTSEMVKNKDDKSKLKTLVLTSFGLLIIMTMISTFLMIFGAEFMVGNTIGFDSEYFEQITIATKFLSIGVILFSITAFLRSILVAFGEFKIISLSYILEQLLKIIIILIASYYCIVILGMDIVIYINILMFSIIISMVFTLIYYIYYIVKRKYYVVFFDGAYKYSNKLTKYLFVSSIVIFAASLYAAAFDQIDLIMLGNSLKEYDVDTVVIDQIISEYFTASWKLILIPISTAGSFISVMLRQLEMNKNNKIKEFDNILYVSILYGLLAMIGLYIVGPILYQLFYGRVSSGIMMMQVIIIPFYIVRNIVGSYVVTNSGSIKSIIYSLLAVISIKIVLNQILFGSFGILGFILASIVSITISLWILFIMNKKMFLLSLSNNTDKLILVLKATGCLFVAYIFSIFICKIITNILLEFVLLFILCIIVMYMFFVKEVKLLLSGE